MCKIIKLILGTIIIIFSTFPASAKGYQNFKVAIYCRAQEVNQM